MRAADRESAEVVDENGTARSARASDGCARGKGGAGSDGGAGDGWEYGEGPAAPPYGGSPGAATVPLAPGGVHASCVPDPLPALGPPSSPSHPSLRPLEEAAALLHSVAASVLGSPPPAARLLPPGRVPPPGDGGGAVVYVLRRPDGWFYCGETDSLPGERAGAREVGAGAGGGWGGGQRAVPPARRPTPSRRPLHPVFYTQT